MTNYEIIAFDLASKYISQSVPTLLDVSIKPDQQIPLGILSNLPASKAKIRIALLTIARSFAHSNELDDLSLRKLVTLYEYLDSFVPQEQFDLLIQLQHEILNSPLYRHEAYLSYLQLVSPIISNWNRKNEFYQFVFEEMESGIPPEEQEEKDEVILSSLILEAMNQQPTKVRKEFARDLVALLRKDVVK